MRDRLLDMAPNRDVEPLCNLARERATFVIKGPAVVLLEDNLKATHVLLIDFASHTQAAVTDFLSTLTL